jgi:hypothetical protein
MLNKIISIGTLVCMLAVLAMARTEPSDPLFYLISINPGATLFKLSLVGAMLFMAFKDCIRNVFTRRGVAFYGVALIIFGVAGLVTPSLGNALYDYLKPMDLLLVIETGIVFSAAAFDKQVKPTYRDTGSVKIPVRVTA